MQGSADYAGADDNITTVKNAFKCVYNRLESTFLHDVWHFLKNVKTVIN
jgi:hypothetical protein